MKIFTRKLLILSMFSFSLFILNAQEQANYWYFGQNAGIEFSTGDPLPLLDGALNTWEGCSSISTTSGSLRFYTDGITVYDRDHNIMPNGNGLLGDPSSTQSGIVVPHPGDDQLYYIFSIDDVDPSGGEDGLNYSLVNMSLNGFKGDVVANEKNVTLTAPLCEKVTAVGHSNGVDIWVITQIWGTNDFYVYKVTSSGLNVVPIISSVGQVIGGSGADIDVAKGYMKVSPDGATIAKANAGLKSVEIFDFDNTSGVVSNAMIDASLGGEPYGVEFSPDGHFLYINTWKSIPGQILYQYDLHAGGQQEIIDSRIQVASGCNGALQLAPDNRIYVAMAQSQYLSRINKPNEPGSDIDFNYNAVYLDGRNCMWGLPPFIQSFFSFNAGFYNDPPCFGTPTQFYENSSQTPDSVFWDFGNSASGDDNYSTELDPTHDFTSPGLYYVKLTVWIQGEEDIASKLLTVSEPPDVDLGEDTFFCEGDTHILDAGEGYDSYTWSTGETTQTIGVTVAGTYWVEVYDAVGCNNADTLILNAYEKPTIDLGSDMEFCEGTLHEIDAGSGYASYLWSTGDTTQTLVINTTGDYWVEVKNNLGCPNRDTVNITFNAKPVAEAGPTQTIDQGQTTTLDGSASSGTGPYSYLWEPANLLVQNDIPNPQTLEIIQPTIFTLVVSDSKDCVSNSDQVLINLTGSTLSAFPFASPSELCEGEETTITANASGGGGAYTYEWTSEPPGFTSSEASFTDTPPYSRRYNLIVRDQFDNSYSSFVEVNVISLAPIDLVPDNINPIGPDTIAVCVKDSVYLDAGSDDDPPTTTYFWTKSNTLGRYYRASTNGNWIDIQTHEVLVNYGGETGCESKGVITIFFDFNECFIGVDESTVDDNAISLYPNPNTGNFSLTMNREVKNLNVKIFDVNGALLYEDRLSGRYNTGFTRDFSLTLDEQGIFIVHLSTDDFHLVKKMIKQ
jgi:PKD repeat protein